MIEIVDGAPAVHVEPAEYVRLLGYPPGWQLEGRAAELAEWARGWYAVHGRPWLYARGTSTLAVGDAGVVVEGVRLSAARLRDRMQRADAHAVVLAAVSAGAELEAEATRLWQEERPDEYFFLEMFGSAVVEHLTMAIGARSCAWAEPLGFAVLPHDSPGYPGWDVGEQSRLLDLLRSGRAELPGAVQALDSGALRPRKSQLAVLGLTRHPDRLAHLGTRVPCENCSLARCQYRRTPYRRAARGPAAPAAAPVPDGSVQADRPYRCSTRALQRWSRERLSLTILADGCLEATFRYEGTTCTNMGRELAFLYTVTLGPAGEGYPIREQHCAPETGDSGHTAMCEYARRPDALLSAIEGERPLSGRPLGDVLSWQRPQSVAGCYCDAASREHKWGLVLETIHYALTRRDRTGSRT